MQRFLNLMLNLGSSVSVATLNRAMVSFSVQE